MNLSHLVLWLWVLTLIVKTKSRNSHQNTILITSLSKQIITITNQKIWSQIIKEITITNLKIWSKIINKITITDLKIRSQNIKKLIFTRNPWMIL
jgi:hypothetical protein